MTAMQIDVNSRLVGALLPFGMLVVGLSLVLLAAVFRSVWGPVKATPGFLLSGALLRATGIVLGVVYVKNGRNLYCSAVLHILINLGSLLPNLVS